MRQTVDNGIKNRLTEPSPMAAEVLRLMAHGVPRDRIAVELSRQFYVDIDLLNAVLRALSTRKKPDARKGPDAVDEGKRQAAA
ncbi:hypothetical protein [Nitratireductor sp. ZSWI3]|uniref:hypothetical protein n=1 Tax=Nitratireductor sp. ZSWI3 TaxID=2966359 RepID=UPI0021500F88|nr:hypothetical protein [Nitratireductor sp. ZSWI3]MCR4267905.1 hypothetical protein [Nitratireductor sp. ZSWI3]